MSGGRREEEGFARGANGRYCGWYTTPFFSQGEVLSEEAARYTEEGNEEREDVGRFFTPEINPLCNIPMEFPLLFPAGLPGLSLMGGDRILRRGDAGTEGEPGEGGKDATERAPGGRVVQPFWRDHVMWYRSPQEVGSPGEEGVTQCGNTGGCEFFSFSVDGTYYAGRVPRKRDTVRDPLCGMEGFEERGRSDKPNPRWGSGAPWRCEEEGRVEGEDGWMDKCLDRFNDQTCQGESF
jgi:hypothetical protein